VWTAWAIIKSGRGETRFRANRRPFANCQEAALWEVTGEMLDKWSANLTLGLLQVIRP
jgi:hypothetical protein